MQSDNGRVYNPTHYYSPRCLYAIGIGFTTGRYSYALLDADGNIIFHAVEFDPGFGTRLK